MAWRGILLVQAAARAEAAQWEGRGLCSAGDAGSICGQGHTSLMVEVCPPHAPIFTCAAVQYPPQQQYQQQPYQQQYQQPQYQQGQPPQQQAPQGPDPFANLMSNMKI